MKAKIFDSNKTVLFNGAMGTYIQSKNLPVDLWEGKNGCNEYLNIVAQDIIQSIHSDYFKAGADIVTTNTFGATRPVLGEYGLEYKVREINIRAVEAAVRAKKEYTGKKVFLSVGPGTKLVSLLHTTYDKLYDAYYEQIESVIDKGIDGIIIETCQDILQIKATLGAVYDIFTEKKVKLPVIVSVTVEENGKLLTGTDLATVATVLSGYDIYALGLNCGFGPDKMSKPIEEITKYWAGELYLSSNAGIPQLNNGKMSYNMSAEQFATLTDNLRIKNGIGMVGGCCGTTPEHINKLHGLLQSNPVVKAKKEIDSSLKITSMYSAYPLRQIPAPTIIAERANATGSKLFRELLTSDNFEGACDMAVAQELSAHILDISVALTDRSEMADMEKIVKMLNTRATVPLMIDSTSSKVIIQALKSISGKPVINSINLEDGGVKLHQILKAVKKFPAAVVALTIDEEGMAQTVERKLAIGERIYKIWKDEYNLPDGDLLIDFLTFSVATGDADAKNAAKNTIEAIKIFKSRHPEVNTVLGVSNVSFGLSPQSRQILNTKFLELAVKAGLDSAIVNAERMISVDAILPEHIKLAEEVLFGVDGALDKYVDTFANTTNNITVQNDEKKTDEEKLYNNLLTGRMADSNALILELLKKYTASHILNEILLSAMQEVGVRFGEGKTVLPFVLKSAEVMQQASDTLAPYLVTAGSSGDQGKIIVATVKGDVHDIGKNLVDIILSGNGYKVYNMGTKVDVADIIAKSKEINADAIGMSGLLVKSVEVMKENIEQMKLAGVNIPILLGGAALTKEYVEKECAPIMPSKVHYCKDPFDAINVLKKKVEIKELPKTVNEDFLSNIEGVSLSEIIPFIRKKALMEGRWGYKPAADKDGKILKELEGNFAELIEEIKKVALIRPLYRYAFFDIDVNGQNLSLVNREGRFSFPIQPDGSTVASMFHGKRFVTQIVTLGSEVIDWHERSYKANNFSKYYLLHGVFTELTEGLANYATSRITAKLNIVDTNKIKRLSFGYPSCPDLQGNETICQLLKADEMGIKLTENYQMEPIYTTCGFLTGV